MGGDREQGKKWKRLLILQCFVKTSYEAMDFFLFVCFFCITTLLSQKQSFIHPKMFSASQLIP